eukprot:COSAG01_NODE_13294_length_1605_cov_7.781690_3_plen_285_part_00
MALVYAALGSVVAFSGPVREEEAALLAASGPMQWAAVLCVSFGENALVMLRSAHSMMDTSHTTGNHEEVTLLEVPPVPGAGEETEADGDEEMDDGADGDDEGVDDETEAGSDDGPQTRRHRSSSHSTSRGGNRRRRGRRIRKTCVGLDALELRPLCGGGLLVREPLPTREQASWTVVSDERPTAEELRDLVFGWRLLPHLPRNAIVLCRDRTMISPAYTWSDQGQGVELAIRVAGEAADGAILACEAPLSSVRGLEHAAAGGVVAVVGPGGATRDGELIEVANE